MENILHVVYAVIIGGFTLAFLYLFSLLGWGTTIFVLKKAKTVKLQMISKGWNVVETYRPWELEISKETPELYYSCSFNLHFNECRMKEEKEYAKILNTISSQD